MLASAVAVLECSRSLPVTKMFSYNVFDVVVTTMEERKLSCGHQLLEVFHKRISVLNIYRPSRFSKDYIEAPSKALNAVIFPMT